MAQLTLQDIWKLLKQTFVYERENGERASCFGEVPVHSVLVIEGGCARWLYGGELSQEAKEGLIAALKCWCLPPREGYVSRCNAVLPLESQFECLIFKPHPMSSYVAARQKDMHENAAAFRIAMAFLQS